MQKQERLLSYSPTIIVATPGRLWELLNERMNPYLQSELPMLDVLVLDEADRMIEDGHFKEMKLLIDYIYQKRVEFKKLKLTKDKHTVVETDPEQLKKLSHRTGILDYVKGKNSDFVVKNLETKKGVKIDLNKIEDLYDESGMLEEIDPKDLVLD